MIDGGSIWINLDLAWHHSLPANPCRTNEVMWRMSLTSFNRDLRNQAIEIIHILFFDEKIYVKEFDSKLKVRFNTSAGKWMRISHLSGVRSRFRSYTILEKKQAGLIAIWQICLDGHDNLWQLATFHLKTKKNNAILHDNFSKSCG